MTTDTPDLQTMRDSVDLALIDAGADKLDDDELDTLILQLRGHIAILIPEVEQLAARHPKDDVPARVAFACVDEARRKLRIGNGDTTIVRVAVAERLARVTRALCHHFENLGGLA